MSGGLAKVISIGSLVLAVGGLGLAARSARKEMLVRGGFEAARVLIAFAVVIAMTQITSVSTPIVFVLVALALGAVFGLYQGRNLTLSIKDNRLMAQRTILGIAVWGASLLVMQVAALSARTGAFRFGQALSYFSIASTVGLFLARNQRMQQVTNAALGATAGVAIALLVLAAPMTVRAQSCAERNYTDCDGVTDDGTPTNMDDMFGTGGHPPQGELPTGAGPVYAPPPYEPPPVGQTRRAPVQTKRPSKQLVDNGAGTLEEAEPPIDAGTNGGSDPVTDPSDPVGLDAPPVTGDGNSVSTEEAAGANGAGAAGAVATGGLAAAEVAGQRSRGGKLRGGRKRGADDPEGGPEEGGFWNRVKKKAQEVERTRQAEELEEQGIDQAKKDQADVARAQEEEWTKAEEEAAIDKRKNEEAWRRMEDLRRAQEKLQWTLAASREDIAFGERLIKTYEWTQFGTDRGVDVLSRMAGPAGEKLRWGYQVGKSTMQQTALPRGDLVKGVRDGVVDVAWDAVSGRVDGGSFQLPFAGTPVRDVGDSNVLSVTPSVIKDAVVQSGRGYLQDITYGDRIKNIFNGDPWLNARDPLQQKLGFGGKPMNDIFDSIDRTIGGAHRPVPNPLGPVTKAIEDAHHSKPSGSHR
jgi:hypothetical protein